MIGLGKVWNAVMGGGETRETQRLTSVTRDVIAAKRAAVEVARDPTELVPNETRAAERFVPTKTSTILTTTSGKRIPARIINISQTGVALEAELSQLSLEDIATAGSRPVAPGRRIARGMVFLFKKPLDPKLCRPDIVL